MGAVERRGAAKPSREEAEGPAAAAEEDPLLTRSLSQTDVRVADGEQGHFGTHIASNRQTFMNVLKGNVGPGSLALPFAFSRAGAALGPLGFFLLLSMAIYNMHLLIMCRERLRRQGVFARTYGEVAGALLGARGKHMVDAFIVLTQLGICTVYSAFFGDSFPSADILGEAHKLSYVTLIGVCFPILLLLIVPDKVRSLAYFSAAANLLICSSILWVLVESTRHAFATDFAALKGLPLAMPATFPMFVGNSVYALEGIGLVLPVGNSMRTTKAFQKVFFPAIITACTILWLIGTLCYFSFGEISDGSITAELDKKHLASKGLLEVVNIALCAAVLLTYPLQLRPAAEVIAERFLGYPPGSAGPYYGRLALAVFTAGVAAAVGNNLGLIIALIGSGCCAMLALILPPLMDVVDPSHAPSWARLCWHLTLVMTGVILAILGIIVSSEALWRAETGRGPD